MAFFQLPWLPERFLLANDAAGIRRAFRGMAIDKSRFPDAVLDVYARAAQRLRGRGEGETRIDVVDEHAHLFELALAELTGRS